MSAHIAVADASEGDDLRFDVTIDELGSVSRHQATVSAEDFERMSRDAESAEAFIERCFQFLLDRESKESILDSFDVSVIGRYFPEFEDTISG